MQEPHGHGGSGSSDGRLAHTHLVARLLGSHLAHTVALRAINAVLLELRAALRLELLAHAPSVAVEIGWLATRCESSARRTRLAVLRSRKVGCTERSSAACSTRWLSRSRTDSVLSNASTSSSSTVGMAPMREIDARSAADDSMLGARSAVGFCLAVVTLVSSAVEPSVSSATSCLSASCCRLTRCSASCSISVALRHRLRLRVLCAFPARNCTGLRHHNHQDRGITITITVSLVARHDTIR